MNEMTVGVRLQLFYDQLVAGSKLAGKAIGGIADEGEKTSKKTTRNWEDIGKKAADMGSSLTTKVTLPVIALGAAAVAMSFKFDEAFQQMRATAGVADEEVEGLKESVLELSTTTGRGPQELAESLLLIRSSGFAGAEALDVLEMAAKGASAGMGETRELANALTNVIAGYGKANISAAEAMDILTASVQEGKAEAADMAPQFGRLVPIAAELGVEFSDVAGTLAYLTRATGDAAQSSTALQGILSKLLKPSQQGEEALKGIGESAQSLRGMLDKKGLLGTLVDLRKRLGDTGFNILFDDVQAMNGALQLTGSEMEAAREVIDAVADSAGKADEAFAKWAEGMGAKNSIAWAKVQAGLIQLGDQIAPSVAEVMSFVGDLVAVFSDLPDPVQKAALAFAGLAAASGPLLTVGGNLIKVFGGGQIFAKVGTGALGMTAGIGASAAGFAILAPLVVGAGLALQNYINTKAEAKRLTGEFADALAAEAAGLEGEVEAIAMAELTSGKLGTSLRKAEADLDVFADAIRNSGDEIERLDDNIGIYSTHHEALKNDLRDAADAGNAFAGELLRLAESSEFGEVRVIDLIDRLDGLSDKFDAGATAADDLDYATEQLGDQSELAAQSQELLTQALQETIDTMRASVDPFFALQDAMAGVRDAQAGWVDAQVGVVEAQAALDEAIANHGSNSAEAAEAARGLAEAEAGVEDAQWAASESAVNLVAAGEELRRKLEEQGLSADAVRGQLYDWAIGVGFSEDQARQMADGVTHLTDELDNIPPLTTAAVRVDTGDSFWNLKAIQDRINGLEGRDVKIRIVGTSVGVQIPGGGLRAAGGPVRKGVAYTVGEQGRELFVASDDGYIVPNHELSGSMAPHSAYATGPAVPTSVVELHITGGDRHMVDMFRRMVKVRGGNVQAVLGSR